MTKTCYFCEKSRTAGRRIQHHHSEGWRFKAPKSLRVFKPNLRKIEIEDEGKVMKVDVCMKCYKKIRKELETL